MEEVEFTYLEDACNVAGIFSYFQSKSKSANLPGSGKVIGFVLIHYSNPQSPILSFLMRQKNLVKKSDIASFLSYKVRCANFDLTTMFYIENGAHTQILTFYVKWIFKLTHATTVKPLMYYYYLTYTAAQFFCFKNRKIQFLKVSLESFDDIIWILEKNSFDNSMCMYVY